MIKAHDYMVYIPYTLKVPITLYHESWSKDNMDVYDYELATARALKMLRDKNSDRDAFPEFKLSINDAGSIGVSYLDSAKKK